MFEQFRNAATILLLIIVGLGVLQWVNVWGNAEEEISLAKAKEKELTDKNRELDLTVEKLQLKQDDLSQTIQEKDQEITVHKNRITEIEIELQAHE